jgi:PAS domain S-box-containing protein
MPDKSPPISLDIKNLNMNSNDPQMLSQITKALYANNFELETERSRIQNILVNVSEIIFAVDQDFKITIFNKRAEEVFGKSHEEAVGRFASSYVKVADDETKKELAPPDYTFRDKQIYIPRVKILAKGHEGEYYRLSSSFIEAEDKSRKEAVIILSNITAEVELDKQKDEFISIASHELKTPISIVSNNLWMFKHVSKKKFSKREDRFLGEMEEGLGRLQKIVNNLLDISRIEHGTLTLNLETINIYEEFLKTADNFKESAESKNLDLIIPTNKKKIEAIAQVDKERYIESLENFIGNAIKYTAQGKITLKFEDQSDSYKISIIDTGPGIPSKDYPKIFTKFGRASEGLKLDGATSGNSTGLGLYITKNYINSMNGEAGFDSKIGEGTTFWFTIPKMKKA